MALLNILVLLILLSWTFALAFLLMTALSLQLRALRIRRLVLRPNCLLTRAPLVFLTGQRSGFYFLSYWNLIPRFMYEHGYLIEVWTLPWRNPNLQRGSLIKRLRRHSSHGGRPVHLFYDQSIASVVDEARALAAGSIASVTLADSLVVPPPSVIVARGADRWIRLGFDLHRRLTPRAAQALAIGLGVTDPAWQIERRFLDRGVELAETELTNS